MSGSGVQEAIEVGDHSGNMAVVSRGRWGGG